MRGSKASFARSAKVIELNLVDVATGIAALWPATCVGSFSKIGSEWCKHQHNSVRRKNMHTTQVEGHNGRLGNSTNRQNPEHPRLKNFNRDWNFQSKKQHVQNSSENSSFSIVGFSIDFSIEICEKFNRIFNRIFNRKFNRKTCFSLGFWLISSPYVLLFSRAIQPICFLAFWGYPAHLDWGLLFPFQLEQCTGHTSCQFLPTSPV